MIHNTDGSRQFTDNREIVGGVNNYSKKKNSHKSHKLHVSHAHVKNDDDDVIRAAAAEELEGFKQGV